MLDQRGSSNFLLEEDYHRRSLHDWQWVQSFILLSRLSVLKVGIICIGQRRGRHVPAALAICTMMTKELCDSFEVSFKLLICL